MSDGANIATGNNEKIWRVVRTSLLIGGILVSIALAYGALNERVSQNSIKVEAVAAKAEANEKVLIQMQTDITYIKKGIDDIKQQLKQ